MILVVKKINKVLYCAAYENHHNTFEDRKLDNP